MKSPKGDFNKTCETVRERMKTHTYSKYDSPNKVKATRLFSTHGNNCINCEISTVSDFICRSICI